MTQAATAPRSTGAVADRIGRRSAWPCHSGAVDRHRAPRGHSPTSSPRLAHRQHEHPLVHGDQRAATTEGEALRLIHLKAYADGAERCVGRSVLDIGCNDGYGTAMLATGARRAVGIDVVPKAIEIARGRPGAARIEFLLVDGGRLPFADAVFDLVTAFQVIEHVEDVATLLGEIRRVLVPGGSAVFTTPNAAIRLDPGMTPWNPFHVHEYTAGELAGCLRSVFGRVEIRGLHAPEPLARIELARVGAARDRARRPRVVRAIIGALPEALKARLRRLVSRGRTQGLSPLQGYATSDLWYSSDALDDALDLQAVCTRD